MNKYNFLQMRLNYLQQMQENAKPYFTQFYGRI